MSLHDIDILAKKILVGIAVTAIPAAILLGALWATQNALQTHDKPATQSHQKGRP